MVKAENGMRELYHRRANIVIFSKIATKSHMGNAAFFSLGVFIPRQLLDRNCQKRPKTCTGVSVNGPVYTLGGIPLPAVALSDQVQKPVYSAFAVPSENGRILCRGSFPANPRSSADLPGFRPFSRKVLVFLWGPSRISRLFKEGRQDLLSF